MVSYEIAAKATDEITKTWMINYPNIWEISTQYSDEKSTAEIVVGVSSIIPDLPICYNFIHEGQKHIINIRQYVTEPIIAC